MIGSFAFARKVEPGAINIGMEWVDGRRRARLILPAGVRAALTARGYPALDAALQELDSALSYAVFLALRTRRAVVLTGDSSVWDPDWGALVQVRPTGRQRGVQLTEH